MSRAAMRFTAALAAGMLTACAPAPGDGGAPSGGPSAPGGGSVQGEASAPERPDEEWHEGQETGPWRVVFTGYGSVGGTDASVRLEPRSATHAGRTHGALVVTRETFADTRFTVGVRTEKQVRAGTPNPWEVGWVLWRVQDPDHFYALVLKPNGWELSKQDPAYPGKQRFLASGATPRFPVGRRHEVQVSHTGDRVTVAADGQVLTTFTDTERPYGQGSIGFYTEDARVRFDGLRTGADAGPMPTVTATAIPTTGTPTGH